jgi:hypothetical protein
MARQGVPDDEVRKYLAEARPLDLSQVVSRTRTMLNPELVMKWDSYMATLTSLALRLMTEVAVASGKGSCRPDYLDLSELAEGSMDLIARTTIEKGPSTVNVNWVGKKKVEPRIDLKSYMLLGRFTIPYGMSAHIPVVRPTNSDPFVILYFSKARFAPIEKGRSRKGEADSQGGSGPAASDSGTAATGD